MNRKLRAALVANIRKHGSPPFTEVTLGKLLTDVRKLMEVLNEEKQYPTLKLFCDWVVHSKLSGPKVQKLLSEMDDLYNRHLLYNILMGFNMPPSLGTFLNLQGFKNELSVFLLKNCGIGTPNTLDKLRWENFETVYCNIVSNCLLIYENKKKPLKHIDSAVIAIQKLEFNPAQIRHDPLTVPNGVEWTFFKNEKEAFKLLLTWGSKPALREAFLPPSAPQTPTLPPR